MVTIEQILVTEDYVREALDSILHGVSSEHINPLQELQLIDIHMASADFKFFRRPRYHALHDILLSMIQSFYLDLRTLLHLNSLEMPISMSVAIDAIKEDSEGGNANLIGWSWLYFHYVESQLNISQIKFCELASIETRSIRRYQVRAVRQLTNQIIKKEQISRESQRRNRLFQQLPHKGKVPTLFERDEQLNEIRKSESRHYHIIGSGGIGKSIFVEASLIGKIETDEVDQIIWLDSPNSIDTIMLSVRERLLTSDSKISVRDFLSLKVVAIVLDDANALVVDMIQLEYMLSEFSNAYIYITSQIFTSIGNCLQVKLAELSLSSVQELTRSLNVIFDADTYSQLIWRFVGGNPLAIELTVKNHMFFELQQASLLTLTRLFSGLFTNLAPSARLAWLVLAILKENSFEISNLDDSYISIDDYTILIRIGVAESSNSKDSFFGLTISARYYIRSCYLTNPDLQKLLQQLVIKLNSSNNFSLRGSLLLAESILSCDWLALSNVEYWECSTNFWREGVRHGHYSKWYTILSVFSSNLSHANLALAIGYGICTKLSGKWSDAGEIFSAIAQYAGMHGIFTQQSEALCELAILFRYQGNYKNALLTLDYIHSFAEVNISHDTSQKILLERIEIALELNNVFEVNRLLQFIADNAAQRLVYQLEISIRDTINRLPIPFIESIGDTLESLFVDNYSLKARVHVLMGRIYQATHNFESSVKHLSIALSFLNDLDNDPFALARTQSNLAAVLIQTMNMTQSSQLLESAERIQRIIGDRVGLAATLHNRNVLLRKIVD